MKEIPVIIFGLDEIGTALIEQLHKKEKAIAEQNCTRFKVVAILDETHWFFVPEGLTHSAREIILARKAAGEPIGESPRPAPSTVIQILQSHGIDRGIVVDTTDSAEMAPAMLEALVRGFSISTTNSSVMSGPWKSTHTYYYNPRVRFESTFGSGLPILATLCYLHDIKDDFYQLEGQFLVDNLTGANALKKLVIMGRLAGWPLEIDDIQVDPRLHAEQIGLAPKSQPENGSDSKPYTCYQGEITSQGGRLSICETPAGDPLAGLNTMRFNTRLYSVEPLLLSGAGHQIEMTAGSILGDMIALARENY